MCGLNRAMTALSGGAADDVLRGRNNLDLLAGNQGSGTFFCANKIKVSAGGLAGHIADFQSGQDQIDFRVLNGGTFIGSAAFSNLAGQVRYTQTTGLVECNTDGNGAANFTLMLDNTSALKSADFILQAGLQVGRTPGSGRGQTLPEWLTKKPNHLFLHYFAKCPHVDALQTKRPPPFWWGPSLQQTPSPRAGWGLRPAAPVPAFGVPFSPPNVTRLRRFHARLAVLSRPIQGTPLTATFA